MEMLYLATQNAAGSRGESRKIYGASKPGCQPTNQACARPLMSPIMAPRDSHQKKTGLAAGRVCLNPQAQVQPRMKVPSHTP